MLFVDDRAGSSDLIKPLRAAGLPVEEMRLDEGDIHFTGRGKGGAPLSIGIEHKKISDLINSMNTQRLQGKQLLGLLDTYDRRYLIVEGNWDHDAQGRVTMWRGRGKRPVQGAPPAVELEKRLLTLGHCAGIWVQPSPSQRDTVRFIQALYRWWTDTDADKHKSHLGMQEGPEFDRRLRIPISLKREIAARLPGVGYERSGEVDRYFHSIREMINAPEEVWVKISGIGKGIAKKVVEAVTR